MPSAAKPKPHPSTWGRLSEDLTGPKHPHRCQKCGRHKNEIMAVGAYLEAWIECDANDESEDIIVMLCTLCDGEGRLPGGQRRRGLIARHKRLYKDLPQNAHQPGIMDLCVHCSWRDRTRGTYCAHPERKANGGAGTLYVEGPASAPVHLSCRPRSLSDDYRTYGQATICSGREEEDVIADLVDDPAEPEELVMTL